MRPTVTYLSALAFPLPAYSFIFTSPASIIASARVRHPNHLQSQAPPTHALYHGPGLLPQSVLMTHAVNLSPAVGTGEAIPMVKPQQETPAAPTFDRSKLGFHFKIGSKVMNL